MFKKDQRLADNAKFVSAVKYFLINSQNRMHVMSDVTLHVNMTPLSVEDRLLIKTCKLKNAELLKK